MASLRTRPGKRRRALAAAKKVQRKRQARAARGVIFNGARREKVNCDRRQEAYVGNRTNAQTHEQPDADDMTADAIGALRESIAARLDDIDTQLGRLASDLSELKRGMAAA